MAEALSTSELFPFRPVEAKDNPIPIVSGSSHRTEEFQKGKYSHTASLQNSWSALQEGFFLPWPHAASWGKTLHPASGSRRCSVSLPECVNNCPALTDGFSGPFQSLHTQGVEIVKSVFRFYPMPCMHPKGCLVEYGIIRCIKDTNLTLQIHVYVK